MFGRLKGYFPHNDIDSRELYRSIYCGSCFTLNNSLGLFGRVLLSHELAAAFTLISALSKNKFPSVSFFCPFTGIKSRKRVDFDKESSRRIIDLYLFLLGLKLEDNLQDERYIRRIIAGCGKGMIFRAFRDSESRLKENEFPVEKVKSIILSSNSNRVSNIDEIICLSGNLFGLVAGEIARIINRQDINNEIIAFGESVGRVIALVDMLDDLSSDLKLKRPNPIAFIYGKNSNDVREILRNASDDLFYLTNEYLCDISIFLSSLKPFRYEELLRGVFGRSMERALLKHFGNKSQDGIVCEEVIA